MQTAFSTLAAAAHAEIEVKRSRFLCTVRRVEGEDAARQVIAATREDPLGCRASLLGDDPGPGSIR